MNGLQGVMRQGFTLIELSIVLLIIGLITGGILLGGDLIEAAERRQLLKQLEGYNTAVNAFRTKYNCMPGDCIHAEEFGLGTAGSPGHNGDGNDTIGTDGSSQAALTSDEIPNFWYHLMTAQLIKDVVTGAAGGVGFENNYQSAPPLQMPVSNVYGRRAVVMVLPQEWTTLLSTFGPVNYETFKKPHAFFLTADLHVNSSDGNASFLPEQAAWIDGKIDDGLPTAGLVQAPGDNTFPPYQPIFAQETPTPGGIGCLLTGNPVIYNIQSKERQSSNLCALLIGVQF